MWVDCGLYVMALHYIIVDGCSIAEVLFMGPCALLLFFSLCTRLDGQHIVYCIGTLPGLCLDYDFQGVCTFWVPLPLCCVVLHGGGILPMRGIAGPCAYC